jgi:hypothetical protein
LEAQLLKKIQSAKLKIEKEIAKENRKRSKSNMPIVKCSCGAKILLVPDLAAMDRAIKKYMAEHKCADEQFLIEQILTAASKQTYLILGSKY